jgi:AcrR family transcriptional regulator
MKLDGKSRTYRMSARADAAAATGQRIIDAAVDLFRDQPSTEIRLEEVAARAGVTVQTVLRRFGSKDRVFEAATERETGRVAAQRSVAVPGDLGGAIANLVEHYERDGDLALRMLAEEDRAPGLRAVVQGGRDLHRAWCERVFDPFLTGLRGEARTRRLAQFVAVCDVYTWMLLRRQAGLSRAQTQQALTELLLPLTKGS